MQAPQGAGGGSSLTTALQNRNVQIGLGVVGLLIVIAVIVVIVMNSQGGGGASTAVIPASGQTALSGPSNMTGDDDPAAPPISVPGGASFGMPGTATTTGTTGGTATAKADPQARPTPGVSTRRNPFEPNVELAKVMKEVPPPPTMPEYIADRHALYEELNPTKPSTRVVSGFEDEEGGPPIPPMRVAGFVEGSQLSAILQIGSGLSGTYINATPGKMIEYAGNTYRVESIEQGKVSLVNRWEIGDRKGTQRIDVELANAATRAPAYAAPIYGGTPGSAPTGGSTTAVGGSDDK